ncbi:FKBP-type peptidyl-prolyl cis-trans isomerase [Ceratobasidium sp. AG-Ba]|nr:FKBP-type peptidyl-prolyl cis-trans isomerase [Ceratobasidium sp. AG-Ba]
MGVEIQRIKPGDGKTFPQEGDKVQIHYVGKLQATGEQFDSSRDRGKPFETLIGMKKVIKGVPQLSLGEKAVLTISPDYGYGAKGYPPVIPPNSTLIFEVELLKIN